MKDGDVKFYPSGDRALTMEFGREIVPSVNDRVLEMKRLLEREALPGVTETVPSYCSLLVLFDPERISYDALCGELRNRLTAAREDSGEADREVRIWKVPCCYGSHFGPDLDTVCRHTGLDREEVIRRHSAAEYRIYMLGFLPGFVYLGGLDPQLATPRLSVPRVRIPRGAVGIGGSQTGIYPLVSPGGWQLIGSTPLELYDPDREDPVFFRAGDRIRFEPVSSCEYYDIRQRILRGSYTPELLCKGNGPKERPEARSRYDEGSSRSRSDEGRAVFEVLQPGPLTTVQDAGRYGFQQLGVPVSGAMDQAAYRLANALVGNRPGAAVLEMTLFGGSYRFLSGTEAALTGADMEPRKNGMPVPMGERIPMAAGDLLELGPARFGCRTYLAVSGGILVPEVMGSRSTYVKCGIGGFRGRALKAGDVIEAAVEPEAVSAGVTGRETDAVSANAAAPEAEAKALSSGAARTERGALTAPAPQRHRERGKKPLPMPANGGELTVRVIPGPQDAAFTEKGKETFYSSVYILTAQSDRMGCRLEGPAVESLQGTDIVSDGTVFGSIQVTGAGKPIVLMADRQTSGGYAKIATVRTEDLPLLAQAVPGTRIRFAVTR